MECDLVLSSSQKAVEMVGFSLFHSFFLLALKQLENSESVEVFRFIFKNEIANQPRIPSGSYSSFVLCFFFFFS